MSLASWLRYRRPDVAPSPDPYWSQVSLLLRWGPSAPVDVSANAFALSAVRDGFPTQQNATSPYVPFVPGFRFANHGIRLPSTPALQFGADDFTVDFWMNAGASQTPYSTICDASTNNSATMIGIGMNVGGTAGRLNFAAQGGTGTLISQSNVLTNAWVHAACVKHGASGLLFINGHVEASTTAWGSVTNAYLSGGELGGSAYSAGTMGDNYYTGSLIDVRITKGVARYTADFVPPTAPYPTQGPDVTERRHAAH